MSDQYGQAQQEPPRYRWRRVVGEFLHRCAWPFKCCYWRTLYQPHMRFIHRHGWHWFHIMPMNGSKWCQWCGERREK